MARAAAQCGVAIAILLAGPGALAQATPPSPSPPASPPSSPSPTLTLPKGPEGPSAAPAPSPAVASPTGPGAPAAPAADPVSPPPAPKKSGDLTSLRLLRAKGVISEAEYASAMKDLGESVGPRAADATTFVVLSKWSVTLYGFAQVDYVHHSTQSCAEFCGNTLIAREGTYAGDHGRTTFSVRDSRFGLRVAAPEASGVRVSANLETDFFGPTTTTEQGTWVNPVLRVRHAFMKVETPVVDLLFGQTWHLFGWQPAFLVASVQLPGLPGQVFARTPQLRVSKTIKSDDVTLEIAAGAMRPPQRDSSMPEGVGGFRLAVNNWTGTHSAYMTSTALTPASIAVTGDVRQFALPDSANPSAAKRKSGAGIAVNAFIPVVPASKSNNDNSLSLTGEFVTGAGIGDMYTAMGGAGTASGVAGVIDAGLAAYDNSGNLELIKWRTFMVGLEYYLPGVDGRVGVFANYGRSESPSSDSFLPKEGGAAKVRAKESYYNAGLFFDATKALRFGLDGAIYEDEYVDGKKAKNRALQLSAFMFF